MKAPMAAIMTVVVAVLAWSAPARAAEPNGPDALVLTTASPGGTHHAYGAGLARMLTRVLGIPVAMRATEGSNQNLMLIEAGEAQLGFVTIGAALQGWNGVGDWTRGRQHRTVRAMYDTPFQFVVLPDLPVRSLADLGGKRLGVGPQAGTAGTYAPPRPPHRRRRLRQPRRDAGDPSRRGGDDREQLRPQQLPAVP